MTDNSARLANPKRSFRGFTLLEVMVALAVLAVALGAIVKGATTNAANAGHLRDKTYAHWVAMNVVAEMQLSKPWPNPGKKSGTAAMAGADWTWRAEVKETEDEYVRQLKVEVLRQSGDRSPLETLNAYLRTRQ